VHIASYELVTTGVIGFNISSLALWDGSSSSIVQVEIYLPPLTLDSIAYVDETCTIYGSPLNDSWAEYNITANNHPSVGSTRVFSVYDTLSNPAPADITAYVKSQIDSGFTGFSFSLQASTSCAFPQREYAATDGTYAAYVRVLQC